MRRAIWWLTLAMFLIGVGCARSIATPIVWPPVEPPPKYLLLGDNLPSNLYVCVPLVVGVADHEAACASIDAVRWFLRSQRQG